MAIKLKTAGAKQGLKRGQQAIAANQATEGRMMEKYFGAAGGHVDQNLMASFAKAREGSGQVANMGLEGSLMWTDMRQQLMDEKLRMLLSRWKQQEKDNKQRMIGAGLGAAGAIGGGMFSRGGAGGSAAPRDMTMYFGPGGG